LFRKSSRVGSGGQESGSNTKFVIREGIVQRDRKGCKSRGGKRITERALTAILRKLARGLGPQDHREIE